MDFETFVRQIKPMKPAKTKDEIKLAKLLVSDAYIAEAKEDGCHYLMFGHKFFSTEHVEKTGNFPHLVKFFNNARMPNLILDGEINYPGKTSQFCTQVTGSLPEAAKQFQDGYGPIHYTIWSILRLPDGRWTHQLPFYKQREWLEFWYNNFIKNTSMAEFIHITDMCTDTNKNHFLDKLLSQGKEGIILKRRDGLYHFGKKPAWEWVKVKKHDTYDLFIIGYKEATVEYKGNNIEGWPYWDTVAGISRPVTKDHALGWIGALILGAYVDGKITEICACSGLNEEMKKQISYSKEQYVGRVVRINFMEKTEAGYPRHPTFDSFHETKTKEECSWEFN